MNINPKFENACGQMPKQTKWTSIQENKLKKLKAKAELFDEIVASHSKMKRCCQYLRDGFGVMACLACQQATFNTLLDIEQILAAAEEPK